MPARPRPRPRLIPDLAEKLVVPVITLFAIPHNGNLSNGVMYPIKDSYGKPVDRAYAESRARNELLTEIIQTKGQSETHPQMAPNDEFAGFEIWTKPGGGPGTVKVEEGKRCRLNGEVFVVVVGVM